MRRRSRLLAAFLAAFIALATTGSALADQLRLRDPVGDSSLCLGQSSTLEWLVPIYRERPVPSDPDRPQYPDGATVTLSLASVVQPSYATIEVTVLDPTVVLPDDWTSQPDFTASTDTFLFHATLTYTGGYPAGFTDFSLVTFEMSAGDLVTHPSVDVFYSAGGPCSPTVTPSPLPAATSSASPTEAAEPVGAVRPTPPPTDTVVTRPTSPASGPLVVVLVGLVGMSIAATRWLRRR
jgi:hypothetical protein